MSLQTHCNLGTDSTALGLIDAPARAGAAAFEAAFSAIAARGDLLFDGAPSGGSSVADSSAAS